MLNKRTISRLLFALLYSIASVAMAGDSVYSAPNVTAGDLGGGSTGGGLKSTFAPYAGQQIYCSKKFGSTTAYGYGRVLSDGTPQIYITSNYGTYASWKTATHSAWEKWYSAVRWTTANINNNYCVADSYDGFEGCGYLEITPTGIEMGTPPGFYAEVGVPCTAQWSLN